MKITATLARYSCPLLFAALSPLWLLVGCASLPQPPQQAVLYDFGSNQTLQIIEFGQEDAKPLLALASVSSSSVFDNTRTMFYRLEYSDGKQLHPYAQARWAMPPAALVQQRLVQHLESAYSIVSAGEVDAIARNTDDLPDSVLRIHLEEFSQVFSSPEQSEGVIRIRAMLVGSNKKEHGARVLGQRLVVLRRPAPTPDAPGGVRALADATDAAARDIAQWIYGFNEKRQDGLAVDETER